jgi:hypothetical protein
MTALPKRSRGRQSATAEAAYREKVEQFCGDIQEIASRLDFKVSSRGWCYILEDRYGLPKGDFDSAQRLINDCRKGGGLPLDICAEDENRTADHLEYLDEDTAAEHADGVINYVRRAHLQYTPFSFWDDLDVYVEVMVEKIDLKSLFSSVCAEYRVPLVNSRGWSCLNSRAAIMERFAEWEKRGKQCVLLFCGDHDPGGLAISDFLRSNFEDMSQAVGWTPDNLIIDRFGLNSDFIEQQGLSWIENLETSAGGRLDDPRHPDHHKSYVQDYLRQFGARKVEANALVVRPAEGRRLCREAIRRYVPDDAIASYEDKLQDARALARGEIARLLNGGFAP